MSRRTTTEIRGLKTEATDITKKEETGIMEAGKEEGTSIPSPEEASSSRTTKRETEMSTSLDSKKEAITIDIMSLKGLRADSGRTRGSSLSKGLSSLTTKSRSHQILRREGSTQKATRKRT